MKTKCRISKLLLLALTALFVFTGCTEPVDEFNPRGNLDVIISRNATARSIAPVVGPAGSYVISFERTDGESWPVPESVTLTSSETSHSFTGVHMGSYKVTVNGYKETDSQTTLVMTGSNTVKVVANTDTSTTVQLDHVVTDTDGTLEVTYDWSAVKDVEGPLKKAVDDGTLILAVVDAATDQVYGTVTETVSSVSTSVTFKLNMPAKQDSYRLRLELKNSAGHILRVNQDAATIRSGIVSKPDSSSIGAYTFTADNVPRLGAAPTVIKWDIDKDENTTTQVKVYVGANPDATEVVFYVTDVTTEPHGEPIVQKQPVKDGIVYKVTGLQVGHKYDIDVQLLYGLLESPIVSDERLSAVETMVPVESITIQNKEAMNLRMDVNAEAFEVKAVLNPTVPSFPAVDWTFGNAFQKVGEPTFDSQSGTHGITLKPQNPGKTTVTVTSIDTLKGVKKDTTAEFTVALAKPVNVTTAMLGSEKGIKIDWQKGDTFSDSFTIARFDGSAWNESYATVGDVLTYTDSNIEGGKSYQYKVYATFSTDSQNELKSDASAETSAVVTKLNAPTEVSAALNSDNTALTVTWTASDPLADSYILERNDGTGFAVIAETVNGTSFDDRDLTGGKSYTYRVTAKNSHYTDPAFNSVAAVSAGFQLNNSKTDVTITLPNALPTASISTTGNTVTETSSQTFTVTPVEGATAYSWYIDGSKEAIQSGIENSVTVTYENVAVASASRNGSHEHIITVVTDNGISATASFNVSFLRIKYTAPSTRLPLDYNGDLLIWTEHSSAERPVLSIKQVVRDGQVVPNPQDYATIDQYGELTLKGYGDVTVLATAGSETAEVVFSIYENTLPSGETAINEIISAVNAGIMPIFTTLAHNFEGDWWGGLAWDNDVVRFEKSEAYRKVVGSYADARFYLNEVSFKDASIGDMTADSKVIYVALNNKKGYTGTEELDLFGSTSDVSKPDETKNMVTVKLPYNQGTLDVCYMNQHLMTTGVDGKFFIRFNSNNGTYDGSAYQFKAGEWTEVVNNSGIDPQIKFKYR